MGNLENMLSERPHSQKATECVVSFIINVQNSKFVGTESRLWLWVGRGKGRVRGRRETKLRAFKPSVFIFIWCSFFFHSSPAHRSFLLVKNKTNTNRNPNLFMGPRVEVRALASICWDALWGSTEGAQCWCKQTQRRDSSRFLFEGRGREQLLVRPPLT